MFRTLIVSAALALVPTSAIGAVAQVQPSMPVAPPSTLAPGQVLGVNQALHSPDGRYTFVQQLDGNLVLYNPRRQGVYSTNTARSPGAQAVMQPDGNLVVYDRSHRPVFNSNTAHHPGAHLAVQNDGNVVIYDRASRALWQTATNGR